MCDTPREILDPKATDAPLAPSSMVPTTQLCSASVCGPCAVVLSATTTHTINIGIQCESLAPAIQVVSQGEVPFVCLPQVFRFRLVCTPQVPLSSSPDTTCRSPRASSHPPQVRSVVHQRPPVVHHQHSVVDQKCPNNPPLVFSQPPLVPLVLPPHPLDVHHQLPVVYH